MKGAALGAAVLALAACGDEDAGSERLTVFAAASLTEVFEELAPEARFNFAGSDELATQLREGAQADVYAAASPRYPRELHADGIAERPVVFATNRLVVIVPRDNPARVQVLGDLAREGVRLVVGGEGVPIGDYTRELLARAGRRDVLDRVVSEEEDVKGVVGKVALGEADAGFVYATDANATEDVAVIELPSALRSRIEYPAAVVTTTEHRDVARAFVELLQSERGRRALQRAGFGLP